MVVVGEVPDVVVMVAPVVVLAVDSVASDCVVTGFVVKLIVD